MGRFSFQHMIHKSVRPIFTKGYIDLGHAHAHTRGMSDRLLIHLVSLIKTDPGIEMELTDPD